MARKTLRALLCAAFAGCAGAAWAAPDEIQVYTDEMDDPGGFGLEMHVNYALKGAREPAHPGAMPAHHALQMTPEFSYGISKSLEAGLYLPVARAGDGAWYGNGLRLRLKYVAPREEDEAFFWGLNTEIGVSSRRVAESRWGMELRPILGWREQDWLLVFNPIVNVDLSTNVSREPQFEPAVKLSRRVDADLHAGIEYYGEYGPLHHRIPVNERAHYLYGVVDFETHGMDINFGIGRGFVNAGDRWVAKAIVAFPFK